jgi:hypothetical protein
MGFLSYHTGRATLESGAYGAKGTCFSVPCVLTVVTIFVYLDAFNRMFADPVEQ